MVYGRPHFLAFLMNLNILAHSAATPSLYMSTVSRIAMPLISWIHRPTPSHVDSRISWLTPAVAIVEPTNAPSR